MGAVVYIQGVNYLFKCNKPTGFRPPFSLDEPRICSRVYNIKNIYMLKSSRTLLPWRNTTCLQTRLHGWSDFPLKKGYCFRQKQSPVKLHETRYQKEKYLIDNRVHLFQRIIFNVPRRSKRVDNYVNQDTPYRFETRYRFNVLRKSCS